MISTKKQKQLYTILQFVRNNIYSALYKNLPVIPRKKIISGWESIPTTTISSLREYTKNLSHYPEKNIRYLISEFDAQKTDTLFLIPQKTDTVWELLEKNIKKKDPTVAILIVPGFWQMGPMFYQTCRKNKIPVAVLSPRNLPLAVQVIKETKAQLITTTPDVAKELSVLLSEQKLEKQIKTWHLVTSLEAPFYMPNISGNSYLEYHIFPGFPIGYANRALFKKQPGMFFPNSEYFFEIRENTCFITSFKKHALPFIRLYIGNYAKKNIFQKKEIIALYAHS